MKTAAFAEQSAPVRRTSKRTPEFILYFSLIFLIAIPFATVDWIVQVFKRQTLNLRGPLARAWAEADRITPVIFTR
ncbi:MAG: cytochrome PufQ [Pseudomonadota bacterium]